MPIDPSIVRRVRQGRSQARLGGGFQGFDPNQFTPTQPGEEDFSQQAAVNSQAQFEGAAAEKSLWENQRRATNALSQIEMYGGDASNPQFDPLREAAEKGFMERAATFGEGIINFIDGGRQAVNLLIQGVASAGQDLEGSREAGIFDFFDALWMGIEDPEQFEEETGLNPASGSKTLDLLGWEAVGADETGFGAGLERVLRGGAHFGLDMAADPLTYMTFGLSGLGRKAGKVAVESAMDDVVREIVPKAMNGTLDQSLGELSSDYARHLADFVTDDTTEFLASLEGHFGTDTWATVKNRVHSWMSTNGHPDIDMTNDWAVMAVAKENATELALRQRMWDEMGIPVISKKFDELNPLAREILPAYAWGGARVSLNPFTKKGLEKGILIPGSQGKGRQFFGDPIRKVSAGLKEISPAYKNLASKLDSSLNHLDADRALIKGLASGELKGWQYTIAKPALENIRNFGEREAKRAEINALEKDLVRLGKDVWGEDADELATIWPNLSDRIEKRLQNKLLGPDVAEDAAEAFNNPAFRALDEKIESAAEELSGIMKGYHDELIKLNPAFADKYVKNYLPHQATNPMRDFLKAVASKGGGIPKARLEALSRSGDNGAVWLSQLIAATSTGGRIEAQVGAARQLMERGTGRVSAHQLMDDDTVLLFNHDVLRTLDPATGEIVAGRGTAYASVTEMNEAMVPHVRQLAEDMGIDLPKGWDEKIFNDNALDVAMNYIDSLDDATGMWRLVDALQSAGLAVPHSTVPNAQGMMQAMYGNLMKQASKVLPVSAPPHLVPSPDDTSAPVEWLMDIVQSDRWDNALRSSRQAGEIGDDIPPVEVGIDADGNHILLDGHRRLAAAHEAGIEDIPTEFTRLDGVDERAALEGKNFRDHVKPAPPSVGAADTAIPTPAEIETTLSKAQVQDLQQGLRMWADNPRLIQNILRTQAEGGKLTAFEQRTVDALMDWHVRRATPTPGLFRGMDFVGDVPGIGDVFDIPMANATKRLSEAEEFAGDNWVVAFGDDTMAAFNPENTNVPLVSGSFRVTEVDEANRRMLVEATDFVEEGTPPSPMFKADPLSELGEHREDIRIYLQDAASDKGIERAALAAVTARLTKVYSGKPIPEYWDDLLDVARGVKGTVTSPNQKEIIKSVANQYLGDFSEGPVSTRIKRTLFDEPIETRRRLVEQNVDSDFVYDFEAARDALDQWAGDSTRGRQAVEALLYGGDTEFADQAQQIMGWWSDHAEPVNDLRRALNAEEVSLLQSMSTGDSFEIAMASADQMGVFWNVAAGQGWVAEFGDRTLASYNFQNLMEQMGAASHALRGAEYLVSGRFKIEAIDHAKQVVRLVEQEPLFAINTSIDELASRQSRRPTNIHRGGESAFGPTMQPWQEKPTIKGAVLHVGGGGKVREISNIFDPELADAADFKDLRVAGYNEFDASVDDVLGGGGALTEEQYMDAVKGRTMPISTGDVYISGRSVILDNAFHPKVGPSTVDVWAEWDELGDEAKGMVFSWARHHKIVQLNLTTDFHAEDVMTKNAEGGYAVRGPDRTFVIRKTGNNEWSLGTLFETASHGTFSARHEALQAIDDMYQFREIPVPDQPPLVPLTPEVGPSAARPGGGGGRVEADLDAPGVAADVTPPATNIPPPSVGEVPATPAAVAPPTVKAAAADVYKTNPWKFTPTGEPSVKRMLKGLGEARREASRRSAQALNDSVKGAGFENMNTARSVWAMLQEGIDSFRERSALPIGKRLPAENLQDLAEGVRRTDISDTAGEIAWREGDDAFSLSWEKTPDGKIAGISFGTMGGGSLASVRRMREVMFEQLDKLVDDGTLSLAEDSLEGLLSHEFMTDAGVDFLFRYLRHAVGRLDNETQAVLKNAPEELSTFDQMWDDLADEINDFFRSYGAVTDEEGLVDLSRVRTMGDSEFMTRWLGMRKAAKNLSDLSGWEEVTKIFKKMPDPIAVATGEGYVNPGIFQLGGPALEKLSVQSDIAKWMAQATRNSATIYSPEGVTALKQASSQVLKWWKAMATVSRPGFHVRNFIGGMWNGMLVGVGPSAYLSTRNNGLKIRAALKEGAGSIEEAAKRAFPNDPTEQDIWVKFWQESGASGFASTEFRNLTSVERQKVLDWLKVWDTEKFALTRIGGHFMEGLEDFMRMATFRTWYDPKNPGSAKVAGEMVRVVHFDYQNLTPFETRVKEIIPFFVWTRRNLPLQLRTLVENPRMVQRYNHMMSALDDMWADEEQGDMPIGDHFSAFAADTGWTVNSGTPFWARAMIDPDLPIRDLIDLPRPNMGELFEYALAHLGPHISTAINVNDQREFGDVNAPAPMNIILKSLAAVGLYDQTQQGDVRIPYFMRTLQETTMPFSRDIIDPLTGGPTDPRRQARAGITPDDGFLEGGAKALGAQALAALGVRLSPPTDTKGPAYRTEQGIQDIIQKLRLQGELPGPQQDNPFGLTFGQ